MQSPPCRQSASPYTRACVQRSSTPFAINSVGPQWNFAGKSARYRAREMTTFVEELEEFAAAVRGNGQPEMNGSYATTSLAVARAGILPAARAAVSKLPKF